MVGVGQKVDNRALNQSLVTTVTVATHNPSCSMTWFWGRMRKSVCEREESEQEGAIECECVPD